jgi:PAS domain S-box-containing protein
MDLAKFLKTAIRISAALANLHKDNIVHQNIRPRNIRVDDESGEVELIGYVQDPTTPSHRDVQSEGPNVLEVLPYVSPEQTGRMNRPVDYRTDLYSLGVTLYEMLSGRLPFHANDSLGWVHSHIGRPPQPLEEVAPEVPKVLSDIIMRLLSKVAEERYQSARGLERDLKRCLAELEAGGQIEPFPLGIWDVWDKLQIPAKLYGRSEECGALLVAFDRVVQTGRAELMLVSGYSGIGKTSVVQEVHKPIVRERGYFVAGKFEQYKRDVPYLTIAQAFRELIRQVLTGSKEQLDRWRERLDEALAGNGQLVVDLVPQLELIIGKQQPLPPLPPTEAQTRFATVLRHFIGVFAKREHPLALFLDDLQWADLASLRLLHQILTHPEVRHLFILGAYRDNEVSASHPLVATLEEVRAADVRITNITLGPLSLEHLVDLVVDTFHCHAERAEPLAKLLRIKTDGNPFFVTQFLTELYKEQLVRFDPGESVWRWNVAEIQAKNFTDNIVELMVGKLRRLPAETQDAMKLAACIGNQFEVQVLAAIHQKNVEETHQDLRGAAREGLMLRRGSTYKFLHDRVQQAAYTLIPEEQLAAMHLKVGRLLLKRTPESELDDRLFDIVNQLNVGVSLVTETEERYRVAELNYRAGKKAKASSAYGSAAEYFSIGRNLLPEQCWSGNYQLTLNLHLELAECSCLNGNFAESEKLCDEVLSRAATKIDKASTYKVKMQVHTAKAEPAKSVEVGIECLTLFGVNIELKPEKEAVNEKLTKILSAFHDRRISDLINLPPMTDPEKVIAMGTLSDMYPPSLFAGPNLTDLVTCEMVDLSIAHGNTAATAWGFTCFGKALCERLAAYKEGFEFGKLGIELTERDNRATYKGAICNIFSAVALWTHHINMSVRYYRIGFDAALDAGQVMDATFNCLNNLAALTFRGDPLDALYKACVTANDFLIKSKLPFLSAFAMTSERLAQNMRGLTDQFSTFDGNGFSQQAFEEENRKAMPVQRANYFLAKLQARVFSGHFAEAIAASAEVEQVLWTFAGFVQSAEYSFFAAIAASLHYAEATEEEQKAHLELIAAQREKLQVLSESCPDNFMGRYLLVCAEQARLENRDHDAAKLYDRAIRAARSAGFPHIEGLANECAARYYISHDFLPMLPRVYLQEARSCYARWGAHGKVSQLVRTYPELLESAHDQDHAPVSRRSSASAEQLDTMTAVKASQALSSELAPDRLMTTLVRIVIEHAGAQRCCLLLPVGDSMAIAAEGTADHQGINVRIPEPGDPPLQSPLPASLVNYVRRTREKVILNDAASNPMFAMDDYVAAEQPKSLLCLPIVRNTAVVGVLYLENKFVRGAFIPRRLPLVEFLAAISLQNATLYDELAQENAERKQAEATLRKSEERLRRIVETANVVPWEADAETGRFLYVGPQAEKMLGYAPETWYEDDFLHSHVHPDDRAAALERLARMRNGRDHDQFKIRILASDGRAVQFQNVVSASKREDGSTLLGGFLFEVSKTDGADGEIRA